MSANLRFVPDATQAHPYKLSAKRIGDRLTQTCFAYAGWPNKTKDRPVSLWIQFTHRQILDESSFYFFQIVMIAIESLLRLIEIEIVLAQF